MSYPEDSIPICIDCDNTTSTKACARCNITYCMHFASLVDGRYCSNCLEDIKVTEEIVYKTTIYENSSGEEITRKRQIARSLKLDGTDWLFANHQISIMTDEELRISIEYHRNIAGVMLLEREERRTEQLNKLSKVRINIPKAATVIAGSARQPRIKTEEQKQQSAIAKALTGLTPEQLAQVLAQVLAKKPTKE